MDARPGGEDAETFADYLRERGVERHDFPKVVGQVFSHLGHVGQKRRHPTFERIRLVKQVAAALLDLGEAQ